MIKITKGHIKYVLLFNCFFLFSNITCTKKNTTEPEEQGIMGTVFDKQGNPLNNVEVHIMFNNLGDINYPSTHNKLYNSYQQKQTNMNLHLQFVLVYLYQ